MSVREVYDVAIVGAGHNGLVCAAYLARAGLSVKVLERRAVVGGAAVTEEFHPGFRNSVCAYTVSLLDPKIIRDLELGRFGLEIMARPMANFLPLRDGRALRSYADRQRTRDEIAKFSAADAEALADYDATLARLAGVLRSFVLQTPPNAGGGWREVLRGLAAGRRIRGLGLEGQRDLADVFSLSAAEFLGRWFESYPVQALFAFDSCVGNFASPYAAGTAYGLLHHAFGKVQGQAGAWGHARGGMGAISEAMAAAARAAGADIECDAAVDEVLVESGRAVGLHLAGGATVRARVVAANVTPKLLFGELLDEAAVDPAFAARIANTRTISGSFRINLALAELPQFSCAPGSAVADHHGAGIVLAPSLDYMHRAYDDALGRGWSRAPIIELLIPSVLDDGLAPAGAHVASLFCQHFHRQLPDGLSWDDIKESVTDAIINTVDAYAPNFRAAVIGRQVLSPLDLERDFGLTSGDIFHGAHSLNQLFSARPVLGAAAYRMPLAGLYLCGAGAHPGGGVTGAPGHNAAREIIRDFRRRRLRR